MSVAEPIKICKLARFSLTTADIGGLSSFFEAAFGFRRLGSQRLSGAGFQNLLGVEGGAQSMTLRLGDTVLDLLQFDKPGQPYPVDTLSSDIAFQHFAIVARSVDSAYARLSNVAGWTTISISGPERLLASSGGVTAFKFRDPDGHPLELLAFPENAIPARWQDANGTCLGIDHSAIAVSDSARSIAFYLELGLSVGGHTLNSGIEQSRLDGIDNAVVDVTALLPGEPTPHLELLCYRSVRQRQWLTHSNDIAATRLVFEADRLQLAEDGNPAPLHALDPDGHHLLIVPHVDKEALQRHRED